ncbi:unnamed protein product [Urochloa humidicola]
MAVAVPREITPVSAPRRRGCSVRWWHHSLAPRTPASAPQRWRGEARGGRRRSSGRAWRWPWPLGNGKSPGVRRGCLSPIGGGCSKRSKDHSTRPSCRSSSSPAVAALSSSSSRSSKLSLWRCKAFVGWEFATLLDMLCKYSKCYSSLQVYVHTWQRVSHRPTSVYIGFWHCHHVRWSLLFLRKHELNNEEARCRLPIKQGPPMFYLSFC